MKTPRLSIPVRKSAGFTLIEALVALSLLSIVAGMAYSFYLFAHKQIVVREKKAYEFDSSLLLLESITKNIRNSRATLYLDETTWIFLRENGDTAQYSFADGAFRLNSTVLTLGGKSIPKVSFTGFGNDSLLDVNLDHEVQFGELDADGDGRLTGDELANLAWIRVSLSIKKEDSETIAAMESVKNKLAGDAAGGRTYF